jgi:photosystem II stability/assembly factor-like uncharacterized protein
MRRHFLAFAVLGLCAFAWAAPASPDLYSQLQWRNIGPFRGGWSICVEGVPDLPDTLYFGAAGGGVWRTDDAGQTWEPLFQNESAASIGAIAIAPSNSKILYVGTGQVDTRYDIASGRGVYRSDDAGRSWRNLGLADTRAIGRILVDPKNPDVVLVAAFGHIFGPNRERGVYRSSDGGKSWQKTLFVSENTGAVDLAADPRDASIVYAAVWQARTYPWLSYFQPVIGPESGIFKSLDGGKTWHRIGGPGWPSGALGRIGLAVAGDGRVYATIGFDAASSGSVKGDLPGGLYRSDDGGNTWKRMNPDPALASNYFGRVCVDPRDSDTVYIPSQSIRRSRDGGTTFEIYKGAPGGDDYHYYWINPKHPDHMATASDQGTAVTVNGGKSWSTWYNQPTGQFYHLAADDRFPYWIYSGQQDSGTVAIASRSDYGALSFREWHPVGGEERDYDIPDPADPETVYCSSLGGTLARFDGRTGQSTAISPHVENTYGKRATDLKYRYTWITPLAVSPLPPYALYMGSQYLFRSTDRGASWSIVSPDLSGAVPGTKGCSGEITNENARPCGFGVIYSIALSSKREGEIWVGTDDGRVEFTENVGKSWSDVTPAGLPPWSKIASLDLSPLEAGTAYAAVDNQRFDDFHPHAYRTHDSGKSWTAITAGLPDDGFVDVVRADPERRGLLYAGTDTGVYVSFDDGDHWESLKLNLPTAWVRDLLVHGRDLVAATQGRAIWILDDLSPLRQMAREIASAPAHLFAPSDAYRLRRSENRDTPLPPETPLGKNPPAGAVIDYVLGSGTGGPVTLEIFDSTGKLVRKYSSDEKPESLNARQYFSSAWLKPAPVLSAASGHHRFVWDLRYARPKASEYEYSIAAIWGEGTPARPEGMLAPPGRYSVRLTAGGRTFTQPLLLKMDPRVSVSADAMARQFDIERQAADAMAQSFEGLKEVRGLRRRLAERRPAPGAEILRSAAAFEEGTLGFARINAWLSAIFTAVEGSDSAPTAQAIAELGEAKKALDELTRRWEAFQLARQ